MTTSNTSSLKVTVRLTKGDKKAALICLMYFIVLVITAFNTNGTCDSGDSVTHFLFAKYAFLHPANYFNHWAKPFFVLVASVFTPFGFVGIKIFNCLNAALAAWFVYKIAVHLNYKSPLFASFILLFTPGFFIHVFSGLTEPFFALILVMGVYYVLKKQFIVSSILVSFLPFVRSEGIIIMGIFALYYVLHKKYKCIPFIFLGHILYSIAGYFHNHDFLWIVTKIPYIQSSGKYGSGNLTHFVVQLNYILGIPVYLLFAAGLAYKCTTIISNKFLFKETAKSAEVVLIYAVVLAFVAMHSLFWYFGIFESMGLKRVLIAAVPLIAVIAANGFECLEAQIKNTILKKVLITGFAAYTVIFVFTPNPASINWKKDIWKSADQQLIDSASVFIQAHFKEDYFLKYSNPYVLISLNRDPFDATKNSKLNMDTRLLPQQKVILWDSWFSVVENGITGEQLKNNPSIKILKTYSNTDENSHYQVIVGEEKAE